MKGAARRLAAALEIIRTGTGSTKDMKAQHKEIVQSLIALQRLWKPDLLSDSTSAIDRSSKSNTALFELLLTTLIVYSGGYMGNSNAGLASGNSGGFIASSNASTSECVHHLVCDLLVRSFEFSAVPMINNTLLGKNTSLFVKVSLIMVVCRLPLQETLQFFPDAMVVANKNIRGADQYMKQCLIESVAYALEGDSNRLMAFHAEALKIVYKTFQDKVPEVRIAAARLLQVVAERTFVSAASSTGGNATSESQAGSSSNGSVSGSGNGTGASAGTSAGSSSPSSPGVSLEGIMQVTAKGIDDAAPEARRAYSVVFGVVLAKYATTSSGDTDIQAGGEYNGTSTIRSNVEDGTGRGSTIPETPSSSAGKIKSGFKLHVPGINLPSSLSRRKAATVNFSTIAHVVTYFKDMITSKYLSTNSGQGHGGILASFSIALCSMFERLPPDLIAESQLREIMDATFSILDHPFALGDLTRARNAAGFVLRYGLNGSLNEHKQEILLGIYIQKLKAKNQAAESNHHKILSILVEISHMFHSMGESAVTQARDASDVLQNLICHEKQSVRFQAAVALASLVTAIPYRLKNVLTRCLQGLRDTAEYLMRGGPDIDEVDTIELAPKTKGWLHDSKDMSKNHLYAIQGKSAAIVHILRAMKVEGREGLSQAIMDDIYTISEELVESQFLNECADSIWLTCTRAGWTLIGSLVSMNDEQWIRANLEKLLNLWLKSSVLHSRESSLELLRIEAAVIALSAFLFNCQDATIEADNDIYVLASHVLHVYLLATQNTLSHPPKRRGQIARYRLIGCILDCFSMLPPVYSDSYIVLLDLIAEHTIAQALTNLRHSALVPTKSTYLQSVLSSYDDTLDAIALSRLEAGDKPSPLYSRELNHILALQQRENALTDIELEVQYLDTFWRSIAEQDPVNGIIKRANRSPITYVRLVDTCVLLFGRLFHFIPEDLQLRCLQQYAGALSDVRADCEVNVCSLLFAVITEAKRLDLAGAAITSSALLSATSWPLQMQTMLCEMIASEKADVRRGAGEALGLLSLNLDESHCKILISDLEKRLLVYKQSQGASSVTFGSAAEINVSSLSAGTAFALACIKRSCGSRIAINTGLIFRFTREYSQPLRTWILHSWGIILESVSSTGGDYEHFVRSTFSLLEAHIMAGFVYSKVHNDGLRWQIGTKVALGQIINDVVAVLGPELDGTSDRLNKIYSYWMLLRQDGDTRVELEFLRFLEQVAVFAPSRFQYVDLKYLLYILSDTALLNSGNPFTVTAQNIRSSNSSYVGCGMNMATLGRFDEPFEHSGLLNVGVYTNGWSRSILRIVGLSCLRTLVERDPTLIRRQNIFCLLFSALHAEYKTLVWTYLPGLHDMWNSHSFNFAESRPMQQISIDVLQSTAKALLDVVGTDHERAEPCLWALLCRSIAIGESASTATDAKEFMKSPKAINSERSPSSSIKASGEQGEWSFYPGLDVSKVDDSSLASAAVTAQVQTWRKTKATVEGLIALMPPVSRQVRHFAVECVIRVFEIMAVNPPVTSGACLTTQLHFDLTAARRYFLEVITGETSANSNLQNFLCMFLDEFVTLACQVATTVAADEELLMYQCVGLRLLNLLVRNFAEARDPEVSTGDAYLLDPYRAQLSSALRHSLKQVQAESPPLDSGKADNEDKFFFAPLLIEAHCIAGACVSAHLIQDKVALGRILKAVMTSDYGHEHFIGDNLTRISLSLANLASVGGLVTSCVMLAIAQNDAHDDEYRAITTSPLVKALTSVLSEGTEYLFKCWMDSTFAYAAVMQDCALWAQLEASFGDIMSIHEGVAMPALQMPFPPVNFSANAPAAALSSSKCLRTLYKRYWPKIVNAMAISQIYLPKCVSISGAQANRILMWTFVLLSSAILHINANARDSVEDKEDLPAVFRSVPLLLRTLVECPPNQGCTLSSNFLVLLIASIHALRLASKRCCGLAQVEALKAMFSCLSRKSLDFAKDFCCSETEGQQHRNSLVNAVVQAGACPIDVILQLCDAAEQTRHARAVSVGSRTTETRQSSVASVKDTKHMTEVIQFATNGIILLHSTEEARHGVICLLAKVQQVICAVASCYYPSSVKDAVVTLSRASVGSVLALARTLDSSNDASADILTQIKISMSSCFIDLAEWVKNDFRISPRFSLQIVANFAIEFPTFLQADAERLHYEVSNTILTEFGRFTSPQLHDNENIKEQHTAAKVELLRGLHAIIIKLIDARQMSTTNRYLRALGPHLVDTVCASNGYPKNSAELDEMDAAEALLRMLTMQLNDQYGSQFVHMVLPRFAIVLGYPFSPAHDHVISGQFSGILARLLLCLAQTHAVAFREAVTSMVPALRIVLETSLRLAIMGSNAPEQREQSSLVQESSISALKLDLSRYN
ncbi:Uncharacterized conserved protein [Plasmopara halstedii]|uniref:Uncharacterized conserved protein n=1 Tax=Plasmopara halstedii TaxID=4781 RepID=A0A0P1AUV6_PLAHL|nr:Uncharacterized conserved protein [Plasmopara halstedii]CEG44854.1 Uncharacterized conserved protein [Plasmopara halstedii]|eukprot:XP_024581223.1 Uncharacterized conserved protein [Plasmopara halstedii]